MKKCISFFALFLCSIEIFAVNPLEMRFEQITADNGLSQNTIERIYQDSQGYLWIGTRDGLNKYDGIDFKIFRNDRNDKNSLASNWVRTIKEDSEGNIWIGSDGLNIFNPNLGTIVRVAENAENENSFHGGTVFDIELDSNNTLWFATSKGLVHYFPDEDRYYTYESGDAENQFKGYTVYSVLKTRDNRIFIGTTEDPLYEYNRSTDDFTGIEYKKDFFGSNFRKNIEEDYNGLLFIGADGGGMHIFNPETRRVDILPIGNNGLSAISIKTEVLPISKNEVFIGTDGGGINIYDPINQTFDYLVSDPKNPNSIRGNDIFEMFEDIHGNIWIGHFGEGISVWKKHKEKFRSYYHNPFDVTSLSNGVVTAVYQDSNGRIWIGHDGGGLSKFIQDNNTFERIRRQEGVDGTLSTDIIISIDETQDGNLMLGTYGGGLMIFDPNTQKVIRTYSVEDGLSALHIWDIMYDAKGRYWLSTLGMGYDTYYPETDSIENHLSVSDSNVCSNVILSFTESPEGNIWFATENAGICVLNSDGQKIKQYQYEPENINSLSSNDIKCVVIQDQFAWVATNGGGLNRIDLQTDSIKVFTTRDGLASNALMGILMNSNGDLWVSSTKGLMKFSPHTNSVEAFDISQGIQGNEFKYNAQFLLSDGRMIFGGTNGITIFHPDSISLSPIKPNLVFSDLLIFNKHVVPGSKNSPIEKNINEISKLIIRHQHRVFTLEFIALDYTNPQKNKYKYMLDGLDEEWIDSDNRNFVTYSNIPSGTYTFRLKWSNSDGVWSDVERTIIIKVKPPWYKSKLFIALLILSLAYVIYRFIRDREKQAQNEKLRLQKRIDEGQAIIDSKLSEIEKQQEEIKLKEEHEKEIKYQTEGVAKFSDIIASSRSNLKKLSQNIITELVKYVDANIGVLYVQENNQDNNNILKIQSSFCYDTEIDTRDEVMIGEGYIGTCFQTQKTIVIDDLPGGYFSLSSGLGKVNSKHSVVEPVMEEEISLGVIEIASINKLPDYKVQFIKTIAQTIGSVLAINKAKDETQKLLDENKLHTEEIVSHEEELRQNLEELQANQEQSQRREEELSKLLEEKDRQIKELENRLKKKK